MTKAMSANSQQLLIIILFLCEVITLNKVNMNFLFLFILFLFSFIHSRSWQNNQALDSTLIFIIQLTDSITKKDHKAELKTRSCHDFILLNQDTTNRIELRKTVKIGVVMVIRYQGTSPKLGSCQGECPYPCDYVLLHGCGGGGVATFFLLQLASEAKIFLPQILILELKFHYLFAQCCLAVLQKRRWDRLHLMEA